MLHCQETEWNQTRLLISSSSAVLLWCWSFCNWVIGFIAGSASTSLSLNIPSNIGQAAPQDIEALFTPFWQAWQIVHDQYLVQPVDDEKMMQGAIRGMMDSLEDPHSGYMDPVEYSDASAPLEGYSGIGAWVNTEGEYLTIAEPMNDSAGGMDLSVAIR
jgi:hypothetical protein